MSAVYFLKFAGNYMRLTFAVGKTIAQTAPDRKHATPFTSEADAWLAAKQHQLKPEQFVEVENANAQPAEVSA